MVHFYKNVQNSPRFFALQKVNHKSLVPFSRPFQQVWHGKLRSWEKDRIQLHSAGHQHQHLSSSKRKFHQKLHRNFTEHPINWVRNA